MPIINKRVFNKAYMLEFLKNGTTVDIFTFSVPPKGEEFDFGQRVTETKTFGGSVFDDYGNDTIRISLSGSTGNQEKKLIYRGLTKLPLYLNGEAEIFQLQKLIYEWHELGKDPAKKTIYLYDLSKMNIMEFAHLKPSRNYWCVKIKNLKIKRDSSSPYTFNYVLEMFGLVDEPTEIPEGKKDFVKSFTKAMETVQNVMNYTEAAFAAVGEMSNAITKVTKAFDAFSKMSTEGKVLSIFKNIDSSTRILTGNSDNTFYNVAKSCLSVFTQVDSLVNAETKKAKIQSTSTFKVYFNSNGGTIVPSQSIEYSKLVSKPEDPTKNEYTFGAWFTNSELTTEYDFSEEVKSSFTLYASWILAVATVSFNSKSGSSVRQQKVNVGECAVLPTAPTRSGYVFKEWCTDYNATIPFDFTTPITSNMTLYAAWKQVCTVTFDTDDGSPVESQIVSIGDLAVYPITPEKENYTFSCWCTDTERTIPFDFSTPLNNDITLYAQWVQISNTVSFDSVGGTAVASQNIMIGHHATEPDEPTKEGFNFVYWCTDVSATNEFHFDTTPVNNAIQLFAKWAAKVLTVSFDSVGGTAVDTQSVNYNGKAIFPDIPIKENCVFEMWEKLDGETYVEFNFNTEIKEDIELHAKWFGE